MRTIVLTTNVITHILHHSGSHRLACLFYKESILLWGGQENRPVKGLFLLTIVQDVSYKGYFTGLNIRIKSIKIFFPKQKAPLFLGALFVNQRLKLSH